jgi:tRNA pseudouridine13 synthase
MPIPEAYVGTVPEISGTIRATPEDFQVDEDLGFEPDGAGEHVFLRIRKRNANTDWVARQIARVAGVRSGDVSYAGMKDRNAVTTQWFSVQLPGRDMPDWTPLLSDNLQVLSAQRNSRKLRRGALRGNRFSLVVRNLSAPSAELEQRLQCIARQGVPNYFGVQRFGQDAGNLDKAEAMFGGTLKVRDRHVRGLYLSAARSHLFNQVLSQRVAAGTWNRALPGEALMLEGTHSVFVADSIDATIEQRLSVFDIHPTGPLWGRGVSLARDQALAVEQAALAADELFRTGLEQAGLSQERRALRLPVTELQWGFPGNDSVQLSFRLPAGAYATSVLRELVTT